MRFTCRTAACRSTRATRAWSRCDGLEGDRQRDLRFHGGPLRAVSLYSLELIEALQAEGHPIAPGAMGENLTMAGVRRGGDAAAARRSRSAACS